MKETRHLLHQEEIVVNTSAPNEHALIRGDHVIKKGCEAICHQLSYQLGEAVHQSDGAVVLHLQSILLLRE